jgi:hypothetical protein
MRTHQMMRFRSVEQPLAIQIFGYDELRMRWAAEIAEEAGATFVDINCGCPAKKVVNGGGGSNLLRDLPQLRKILTEVKRAISIPMTVKIRAGWDEKSINAVETAKLIEDCGASMVTLHGRTRVQGYRGLADWDLVREIKKNVSIPVSGSGDILSPEDVLNRFDSTGCNAVHIGRTAIANPYIFRQTWDVMNGREQYQPSVHEMHSLLLEYLDHLVGKLLAALKSEGLDENTIVFFIGDNGTGGEGKATLTELGIALRVLGVAMMGEVADAVRLVGDKERPRQEQLRHDGIQAAVLEEEVMRAFVHENGQRMLSRANPHNDEREEDRMQEALIKDDGQDDADPFCRDRNRASQRVDRRELPDHRRRETRRNVPGVGICL